MSALISRKALRLRVLAKVRESTLMLDKMRQTTALETAKNAIVLSEAYDIAPTPLVFEVLVKHIQGTNDLLSAEVETVLKKSETDREDAFKRIHAEYLNNSVLQDGLERVHNGLSSEVSDVIQQLSDGMKGNLRMAEELRTALRDIAGHVTKTQLQTLCRHLVLSGRDHLSETQTVTQKLERTQFQLNEMHNELAVLREAASTDHLTGLPNRRYLDDKLSAHLATPDPLCFAMIDLDHFKAVNDTWGHSVGDNVLRGLGQILQQNTKGKDFAARVGGEEFALVLPKTPLQGGRKLCEAILAEFADILWLTQTTDEEIGSFTFSCGVAERSPNDTRHSLAARADELLYRAKKNGRNQVIAE